MTEPQRESDPAGTEQKVSAVSASRGDIGIKIYLSGTVFTSFAEQHTPLEICSSNWNLFNSFFHLHIRKNVISTFLVNIYGSLVFHLNL